MRSFGASAQQLAQMQAWLDAQAQTATVGVWPEHWHAFALFQAMSTQWRGLAGMGGIMWLGLDYSALPTVQDVVRRSLPRRLRRRPAELLMQLRTLETTARDLRNTD